MGGAAVLSVDELAEVAAEALAAEAARIEGEQSPYGIDRLLEVDLHPALAAGVALALGFDFLLRMLRATIIDNAGRRIDMRVSSDIYVFFCKCIFCRKKHAIQQCETNFFVSKSFETYGGLIPSTSRLGIPSFVILR